MGKHASRTFYNMPRITHEGWHLRHRELVELVTSEEHAGDSLSVGNLADDVWEWIRYALDIDYDCDWCDCEVAARVWKDDHPDGPYPARVTAVAS